MLDPRLLLVALLLALAPARAEYTPPPTLDDLLGAGAAAVGRFVADEDGAVRFVETRLLWGNTRLADALVAHEDSPVRMEDAGLIAWTWGNTLFGHSAAEDATREAVWFFFEDPYRISVLPVELATDVTALRRDQQPSAIFRLLQRLDFDMHREALERLFAGKDREVVAALHRIALDPESLAAYQAFEALHRAGLLDAELFWGAWPKHPARYELQAILHERDPDRVARELRKAAAAETRPGRLVGLLHMAHEDVDLAVRFLDHADEGVRRRALGNLYGRFWMLARRPDGAKETKALALRLKPVLEARRKVETSAGARQTIETMLHLRIPTPEPPPPYSEDEELTFLLTRLTSHFGQGFVQETAGREIARHFLDEGFARLKAMATSRDYNAPAIYEAMGYVRHPRVFAHLVAHAKSVGPGDSTLPATLRAIARQNQRDSFDVLEEIIKGRGLVGFAARGACDALGILRDPRALALLKSSEELHDDLPYLRARVAHGDAAALAQLLARRETDDAIRALLLSDAKEATEALKRHVEDAWPERWESFDESFHLAWCLRMENYAGTARRTTALGEVARRDPRWLADLALRKMESPSTAARICGAFVFRGLTGRPFGFDPEALASQRAAPLKRLRAWWAKHRGETREQWLLSYFAGKGFRMERLDDLPVLVRALEADELTHGLAIERISVATGKYFGEYAQPSLRYRHGDAQMGDRPDPRRMTIRVKGWLPARGFLPR